MSTAAMGVMVPIIGMIGLFITIIYIRRFENLERMAIIEKGLDPGAFKKASAAVPTLRWALLFIGAGTGLLFAYFLDRAWRMEEVAYFSMILIFGGAGLLLAYIIEERKAKESNK
ncbi:hypothetical protein WSM22_45430 [Cytophagales bacterium WSM2-2]|nr:hypothetical protein WSM22_45430 [Cytophagales bacterium WSM2-2]